MRAAARIGYPVAMKAQAGTLAHKTEAGAVMLNVADEAGVRRAWQALMANVQRAQPGIALDGVLVERMAAKGLELVVGAKRDPQWGPVRAGGARRHLGRGARRRAPFAAGSRCEGDRRGDRAAALGQLLNGFRGSPTLDVEALARAVAVVGRLMRTVPEIVEIDINPLFVHPKGEGVTAVDALVVTQ